MSIMPPTLAAMSVMHLWHHGWMRRILVIALLLVAACTGPAEGSGHFVPRVVTSGLHNPYEMIYGPDGRLWVTEKSGRRVLRVDPASGAVSVAGVVTEATS